MEPEIRLESVAAVAENGVIGDGDGVPWNLPAEVRQYRQHVAGAPVIVGRRTFESMQSDPDPPGRVRIVLSRTPRTDDDPATVHVSGVDEAIERAAALGDDVAYVLGGGEIYALFLSHVDRMRLSRVAGEYEGDVFYPDYDREEWRLTDRTPRDGFAVEVWERVEDADGHQS
jgi:dihydrofolate reductase